MISWIVLLSVLFSTSNISEPTNCIRVATASSLYNPVKRIADNFERANNTCVEIIPASSGVLTAQITNGAPFDIFLSANKKYPEHLVNNNNTKNTPKDFATGYLAIWSKKSFRGNIATLFRDSAETIAIANPELAPFGAGAVKWIKNNGAYENLKSKLIYGENIGQVNQFIYLGAVDLAITSNSARKNLEERDNGYWLPATITIDIEIAQTAVLLHPDKIHPLAFSFFDSLWNSESQAIFRSFGYGVN